MDQDKVAAALTTAVDENDAFLVDIEIKPNNVIVAYIDADAGLTIEQIKMISRKTETLLDRDEEDFNLTVSSPDLTRPLKIWRQYKKNEGRFLKVKFDDREDEGQLLEVAEEYIVLSVPQKKKSEPNKELKIEFTALTEAKVAIKFK
ncbi:MAG: ribosome assembly cofactor RimP [Schleiferiaceae bacterium]|nr:ribosome assembly cofactor RimP [Schleiferiaceae bacterium]